MQPHCVTRVACVPGPHPVSDSRSGMGLRSQVWRRAAMVSIVRRSRGSLSADPGPGSCSVRPSDSEMRRVEARACSLCPNGGWAVLWFRHKDEWNASPIPSTYRETHVPGNPSITGQVQGQEGTPARHPAPGGAVEGILEEGQVCGMHGS